MSKKTGDTRQLFNMELFSKQKSELLTLLEKRVKEGKNLTLVFTPNPEQVIQGKEDPTIFSNFNQADYLLPDGVGLVVASRLLALRGKAQPLAGRIPGSDVTVDLLKMAAKNHWRTLVIGGRNYSSTDKVMVNLGQPGIEEYEVIWSSGYADSNNPTLEENDELYQKIKRFQPHLVLVAFGSPQQEHWLIQHKVFLEENGVRLAMGVGGSFDFLLGTISRAPYWLRKLGLEWLYRLIRQPWRWRRQLRLVQFSGLVLRELVT